jgi:hypothetical protein
MKKRFIKILILSGLFFSLFLHPLASKGQYYDESNNRFFDNLNLVISAGPSLFYGDIQAKSPFQEDWKLGFGIGLRKQFSPIFSVGLQFISSKLHGTVLNWPSGDAANLKFDSDLSEFNLHTTFNLSNAFFGVNPERTLNVYGLAGFGVANWMSTLRSTLDESVVAQYGVSPTNTNAWTPVTVFPVGLGVNINLRPNIGINFESTYHITNSDQLDAYTAGNGANDSYLFTSIGLSFKLLSSDNAGSSSRSSAGSYEKDLEKQRKYQQRIAEKEKRKELREEADQERKSNIDRNKRSWGRRGSAANLPKVAEYDPQYSFKEKETVKPITSQSRYSEDIPPSEIIAIDEGKHFITGVANKPVNSNLAAASLIPGSVSNVNQNSSLIDIIQIPSTGTIYTVQIMASQRPAANIADIRLKYYISRQLFVSQQNGVYRYSAGFFQTYDEAVSYAQQLKNNGLSDAFVAIYQNGNRILYRPK